MRKQEYIHLHGLFVELARHLIEEGVMPPSSLVEYHALGTRPVSVSQSKQNHHDAVVLLASVLGSELERFDEERSELWLEPS